MSMINSVRNTVLSVLNKNNYGYISPSDFNLFAKQAQLDIFEDYFYDYNYQINKENARTSGTGLADIRQQLEEVVDYFTLSLYLTYAAPYFALPVDWYTISKIQISPPALPVTYVDIERVSIAKIGKLVMSNLTAPNAQYPAYTVGPASYIAPPAVQSPITNNIQVFPSTIITDVLCTYIRYPRIPKWTYLTLPNGEPLFDETNLDYIDFEIPASDEPNLVNKILQYTGLSIREIDIYKAANQEELENTQEEQ